MLTNPGQSGRIGIILSEIQALLCANSTQSTLPRSKQGASGAWKQKEKVINTSTKKVTCEWNGIDRPRLPERDPTGPTQPTTALPRELMA